MELDYSDVGPITLAAGHYVLMSERHTNATAALRELIDDALDAGSRLTFVSLTAEGELRVLDSGRCASPLAQPPCPVSVHALAHTRSGMCREHLIRHFFQLGPRPGSVAHATNSQFGEGAKCGCAHAGREALVLSKVESEYAVGRSGVEANQSMSDGSLGRVVRRFVSIEDALSVSRDDTLVRERCFWLARRLSRGPFHP